MWRPSAYNDPLRRMLMKGQGARKLPTDAEGVPDLLADNGHLADIGRVQDHVRSLFRTAREYDRKRADVEERCLHDTQRYLVFLCGSVIGGQQRELTEIDRRCLQQILGFDVPPSDFKTIAEQLRSESPETLNRKRPMLLRLQAAEEWHIYDPSDHTISHLETIGAYI